MYKRIIFLVVLVLVVSLHSRVLEVCLSGDKQFTIIQAAIDFATDGDVIIVHPGIYRENIQIFEKSITLRSLYSTNGDSAYIENTVISGMSDSHAIYIWGIINYESMFDHETITNITIDGFTIMNNEFGVETHGRVHGGGLYIMAANVTIHNNIIRNNIAGVWGGGIFAESPGAFHSWEPITLHLANNQIFDNIATSNGHLGYHGHYDAAGIATGGGGIALGWMAEIVLCRINRNSIYNNNAAMGHDILIRYISSPTPEIILDKGSRILTEIDNFFIGYDIYLIPNNPTITIDILQESHPPAINSNLYVAPWGDDSNSGLTSASPLKTINRATRLIANDRTIPKTIHLAAGIYSPTLNDQIFPFILPGNVYLIGSGMNETIIDGDLRNSLFGSSRRNAHNIIKDITITNFGRLDVHSLGSTVFLQGSSFHLENILFLNNRIQQWEFYSFGVYNSIIHIDGVDTATVENVTFKDTIGSSFTVSFSRNLIINNLFFDNSANIWITQVRDTRANNLSITNSGIRNHMSRLFNINSIFNSFNYTAVFNNVLIVNNRNGSILFGDRGHINNNSTIILNNWTVANNMDDSFFQVAGHANTAMEINNSIFYNPKPYYTNEITLYYNPNGSGPPSIEINNSLLYEMAMIDEFEGISNGVLINTSPQFLGMRDGSLSPSMWEYYQLYERSPCINAGLMDISHLNLPDLDLIGNPRVHDGRIDMGAFEFQGIVSEDDEVEKPILTALIGNFPNPFNPSTMISFEVQGSRFVNIEVFNIRGQKVKTLVNGYFGTGVHSVVWNGDDDNGSAVSSGVYFYRMETSGGSEVRRMVLMK